MPLIFVGKAFYNVVGVASQLLLITQSLISVTVALERSS